MGGLGNQMFQYALGRRLAFDRDVPLKLDLSWFKTQELRKFELDQFNIQAEIATDDEVYRVRYFSYNRYFRKAYSIFQNQLPDWKRQWIKEKDMGNFDRNILKVTKNCFLTGYWQSEKYFKPISSKLKEDFSIKEMFSSKNHVMADDILSKHDSVSVHLRRGDYVTKDTGHWVCPVDYYQRSMKFITQKFKTAHFYFFSDDIEYTRLNLYTEHPSTFIKSNGNDVIDQKLMSLCHHHINANSSFSWWGAWLGEKTDSFVIVPNHWYTKRSFPPDRVPERWVAL